LAAKIERFQYNNKEPLNTKTGVPQGYAGFETVFKLKRLNSRLLAQ